MRANLLEDLIIRLCSMGKRAHECIWEQLCLEVHGDVVQVPLRVWDIQPRVHHDIPFRHWPVQGRCADLKQTIHIELCKINVCAAFEQESSQCVPCLVKLHCPIKVRTCARSCGPKFGTAPHSRPSSPPSARNAGALELERGDMPWFEWLSRCYTTPSDEQVHGGAAARYRKCRVGETHICILHGGWQASALCNHIPVYDIL
jgi:hypothetical protein